MCNLASNIISGIGVGISLLNFIVFLGNIIVTRNLSIQTQKDVSKEKQKTFLDQQLFELQRLSFYDPFVEDKKQFLKYDIYTEMIFNFMRQSLDFYKNEDDLLNYVDFKSWIRDHHLCWKNPLQEHSNREVYGEDMWEIIDKWLS